jgi:hypothetical protein
MERGPLALFGAIVAVGLGPALWLGAQFGDVAVSPSAPPAVISEQLPDAGGGAGAAPDDTADQVETTRQAEIKPLTDRPAPRKSSTATTEAPEPDDGPTTTPPVTSEPTRPGDDPTTPPTEDTTDDPTTPPAGDDDGGSGDDNGGEPGDVEPPLPDTNAGATGPVLAGN